jgi:hypothetical protein
MRNITFYQEKSLPANPKPDSVYFIKADNTNTVKVYVTDAGGFPLPLIDETTVGSVLTVTGTAVTGTPTNPIVNVSGVVSSDAGNKVKISVNDGKLFTGGITNTDGKLLITDNTNSTTINLATSVLNLLNTALQAGDNISSLTNDAGYITASSIVGKVNSVTGIGGILVDNTNPTNPIVNINYIDGGTY